MTVNHFTYGGGGMSSSGAITFDSSGDIANLAVGATLAMTSATEPGTYTGTSTFQVVYD
jgi:hypothetical protein